MGIFVKAFSTALISIGLASAANAAGTTVFADSFDDGNVADWTISNSSNVTVPQVIVRTDSFVSGTGSLWTFFDAPSGGSGPGTVRASHAFNAPVTATYTLSLWARSAPCSGCTMSYDVLVDGVSLTRSFAPSAFEQRSFTLTGLTAGTHTLTLGMHTTAASSGRFQASFDDVSITTLAPVPEPDTLAMMLAGLAVIGTTWRRRAMRSAANRP